MAPPSKDHRKPYALITREENRAFELKKDSLIQRVRNTGVPIEDATKAVKKTDQSKRELREWTEYLACDHLPKPWEPDNIRRYFYKELYMEAEDIELTVNWLLAVDELSVLSHDYEKPDLTNVTLKKTIEDFGVKYDTRVHEAMKVSQRIQDFLEIQTRVLSPRELEDLRELKFLAYRQINLYVDNLTYRVLSSEDAYMETVNVTTAQYSYAAKNFNLDLWTFKNVPIYLDPTDTPSITINLHRIKTKITMPFSVLCENMVIRGLQWHFDHFSDHARFYELPKADPVEHNLEICLQNEWKTQMKIQAEVRLHLVQQREHYEEILRLKAEEEEQLKLKRKQKPDEVKLETKKPKKPIKEPPIIDPNVVPQVYMDFLYHDLLESQDALMQIHPSTFRLKPGEINLRKYQILGGVYKLDCLRKPKVTNFPKLIMAWYKAEGIEFRNIQTEMNDSEPSDIAKFFKLSFELADCFCHWGEPIACLFEDLNSPTSTSTHDLSESKKLLDVTTPIIINDFNLHELFNKQMMYQFIENSLPRIISSFKFPDDLIDEDEDKKGKVTLGRAKPTAEDVAREKELLIQRQLLSFNAQMCPERMFPLFKKVFPVIILNTPEDPEDKERLHPYEHFSEFFTTLESIRNSYRKSTFRDFLGNPIKISAESYEKNIRKPKVIRKLMVYDDADGDRLTEKDFGMSSSTHSSNDTAIEKAELPPHVEEKIIEPAKTKEGKHQIKPKKLDPKHKKADAKKLDEVTDVVADEEEEEEVEHFSKWSTANILKSEFNTQDRKVTLWTDRLGAFAFAFYRYEHFPFQSWSLQPSAENPNEVELTIESVHALFKITITCDGYKVLVTDFTKAVKHRKTYLEIKDVVKDVKILKEKLQQKYLNIFPERDATWYMTGYFSEKHVAAEYHTYNCISLYALSLRFTCSYWNALSDRRTMILKFGELRDLDEDLFLLRICPENVLFVEINEVCTVLETVELEYIPTWRNLEWYPDLNHLLMSAFANWSDMRTKDANMINYLANLLKSLRILSCS